MNQFLVICVLNICVLHFVKSDLWSSEEESDEQIELFGTKENNINKRTDEDKCISFLKIEEVESCFATQCEAKCVVAKRKAADQSGSTDVPESCSFGCKTQISTFKAAQSAYRQTSAELLLGTAVDKCWDGCISQSNGVDQTACISGCETMRRIQRQQLRIAEESKQNEEEADNSKEKNAIETHRKHSAPEDSQSESGHVRTYILLHPVGQPSAFQTYNMMMSIVQRMFQEMDSMDTLEDDRQISGGWKDDRRQFRIPQFQPRVSALTSQEDDIDSVYTKAVNSMETLKAKIQEAISSPEFKENLFYVLMTICCFLLLTALYDHMTEDPEEDHYHLPDTAATAKLPTYDDCVKADRYLAVNILDCKWSKEGKDDKIEEHAGEMNKADLGMTFTVVLDEEEGEQK